jgi:hypothetical protein
MRPRVLHATPREISDASSIQCRCSLVFLCTPETGGRGRSVGQPPTCANSCVRRCFAIHCPLLAHFVFCFIVIVVCKCILSLLIYTVCYNWVRVSVCLHPFNEGTLCLRVRFFKFSRKYKL